MKRVIPNSGNSSAAKDLQRSERKRVANEQLTARRAAGVESVLSHIPNANPAASALIPKEITEHLTMIAAIHPDLANAWAITSAAIPDRVSAAAIPWGNLFAIEPAMGAETLRTSLEKESLKMFPPATDVPDSSGLKENSEHVIYWNPPYFQYHYHEDFPTEAQRQMETLRQKANQRFGNTPIYAFDDLSEAKGTWLLDLTSGAATIIGDVAVMKNWSANLARETLKDFALKAAQAIEMTARSVEGFLQSDEWKALDDAIFPAVVGRAAVPTPAPSATKDTEATAGSKRGGTQDAAHSMATDTTVGSPALSGDREDVGSASDRSSKERPKTIVSVSRNVATSGGVACDPALWVRFDTIKTSRRSGFGEMLIHTVISASIPKEMTDRGALELIAREVGIPIESLSSELDQPSYSRGRAYYGFVGDVFDQIARDRISPIQWWLSDVGLNMAPSVGQRPVPTFEERIEPFVSNLTDSNKGDRPAEGSKLERPASTLTPGKSRKSGRNASGGRRGPRPDPDRRAAIATALRKHGDAWRLHLGEVCQDLQQAGIPLGKFGRRKIDLGDGTLATASTWEDLDLATGKERNAIIDAFRNYVD